MGGGEKKRQVLGLTQAVFIRAMTRSGGVRTMILVER
jgi:hypothetical protein